MNWPNFDFDKAHRQRFSDAVRTNVDLENRRPSACRSLLSDFQNIKSKKRKSREENLVQQSSVSSHEAFQGFISAIPSSRNFSQTSDQANQETVPPMSPVLVNGFLRNPSSPASSSALSKDLDTKATVMLTPSRIPGLSNPDIFSSQGPGCPLITSSPKAALASSCSKMPFTPALSPIFPSIKPGGVYEKRNSEISLENGNCAHFLSENLRKLENHSSFCSDKEASAGECSKSEKDGAGNKAAFRSSSPAVQESTHSSASSSTLLETLPPSQSQYGKSQESKSFSDISERYFSSQSENNATGKAIKIRHTFSDNDVFQGHPSDSSDLPSSSALGNRSRDSFLDLTIHETEPNDSTFEAEESQPMQAADFGMADFEETTEELMQQKQTRLSKLAEALKKRVLISSSDLAIWKCERRKQQPAREVTLVSVTEQWGICWSVVKSSKDSTTAQIIDSEPVKKLVEVVPVNIRSPERGSVGENEDGCSHDSSSEKSSQETYVLYHPLSKLNTLLGEVFIAPRYYR